MYITIQRFLAEKINPIYHTCNRSLPQKQRLHFRVVFVNSQFENKLRFLIATRYEK